MSIGEQLAEIRKDKGYTQEDLAEVLHVTKSTLSNYENDRRTPDITFIKTFSKLMDVSVDYIVGTTEIPQGISILKKRVGKNTSMEQIINMLLSLDIKHGEDLISQLNYISFHCRVYDRKKDDSKN